MRKGLSLALVFAMGLLGMPLTAGAAVQAGSGQTGTLSGVAQNASHQALANYTVRVRNVTTGEIGGTSTTSTSGSFLFGNLKAGNYVVEVLNGAGQIVATSASVSVAAGATVAIAVSSAAASAIVASSGGLSLFGMGTIASAAVITGAGVAAIAGVVALRKPASPSR